MSRSCSKTFESVFFGPKTTFFTCAPPGVEGKRQRLPVVVTGSEAVVENFPSPEGMGRLHTYGCNDRDTGVVVFLRISRLRIIDRRHQLIRAAQNKLRKKPVLCLGENPNSLQRKLRQTPRFSLFEQLAVSTSQNIVGLQR